MEKLFRFRYLGLLIGCMVQLSCGPCGPYELQQDHYGIERDEFSLQFVNLGGGSNSYRSYTFLEKDHAEDLTSGVNHIVIDYFPFIPTNTFVFYGPSDTDTVTLSNLNYILIDEQECGATIRSTKPDLATTFDSSQVSYESSANQYRIILYMP